MKEERNIQTGYNQVEHIVGSEPVAVVTEALSCGWFCLIVELGTVVF